MYVRLLLLKASVEMENLRGKKGTHLMSASLDLCFSKGAWTGC